MRIVLLAFLSVMLSSSAMAEEYVLDKSGLMEHGLVCNQPEEVKLFTQAVDSGIPVEVISKLIPGCGLLAKPIKVKIVYVGVFQTDEGKYLLVRYDTLTKNKQSRYGIFDRIAIHLTSI